MKKASVAYQIFSARDEAQQDLYAVLKALKEMGYDGVEFAGFYGHSAEEVRAMLDEIGLKGFSNHLSIAQIEADMEGEIAFHKTIGCEYIAIPYLDDNMRPGGPGFAHAIQVIYKFGRLCKEAGIQLLYHNHDFEFITLSGQYGLDFLYDAVPSCILKTEIDTCWVKYAGEDPAAYVSKYAGRCPVVHLKDYVGRRGGQPYALVNADGTDDGTNSANVEFEFRPVGHGSQNVASIVEAGLAGGAQWFVVEQDMSVGRTPLEAAQMSRDTLKALGI
ncbi:MAG: sugar phosphate isomerase/epimerase [Clostridiales bacterium]|nr:sugar phosphate isomerase/epimerase [Clostridiales bacterium]